jgi:hypothetical protein
MSSAIFNIKKALSNDTNIIPEKLKSYLNRPKALEEYLLNDAELRNKIINFAQLLKVAMSFRANIRVGCASVIPWDCKLNNFSDPTDLKNKSKCISFNDKADLFYFITYSASHFTKILTAAVRINKTLKLHIHFVTNNRIFCPRYKIVNSKGVQVAYFNERVQNNYIKNNLMRAMLSGLGGLPSGYKLKFVN